MSGQPARRSGLNLVGFEQAEEAAAQALSLEAEQKEAVRSLPVADEPQR